MGKCRVNEQQILNLTAVWPERSRRRSDIKSNFHTPLRPPVGRDVSVEIYLICVPPCPGSPERLILARWGRCIRGQEVLLRELSAQLVVAVAVSGSQPRTFEFTSAYSVPLCFKDFDFRLQFGLNAELFLLPFRCHHSGFFSKLHDKLFQHHAFARRIGT